MCIYEIYILVLEMISVFLVMYRIVLLVYVEGLYCVKKVFFLILDLYLV